ncbi:MAG: hypothetical protein ACREEV_15035, partial [Dongiaceae bacterium]
MDDATRSRGGGPFIGLRRHRDQRKTAADAIASTGLSGLVAAHCKASSAPMPSIRKTDGVSS